MKTKEIKVQEIWNTERQQALKKFITSHSRQQTPKEVLQNNLLGIQFEIEDYLREKESEGTSKRLLDFVKMYLEVLDITKKDLADLFEMQDSNLHKYLTGERKLNAEIVMKLAAFSHTEPELWYGVQIKNDLCELRKKTSKKDYYRKFDYTNLVET